MVPMSDVQYESLSIAKLFIYLSCGAQCRIFLFLHATKPNATDCKKRRVLSGPAAEDTSPAVTDVLEVSSLPNGASEAHWTLPLSYSYRPY